MSSGQFEIRNGFIFTDLNKYNFEYTVEENGKPVLNKNLPSLNVVPGQSTAVAIDLSSLDHQAKL